MNRVVVLIRYVESLDSTTRGGAYYSSTNGGNRESQGPAYPFTATSLEQSLLHIAFSRYVQSKFSSPKCVTQQDSPLVSRIAST